MAKYSSEDVRKIAERIKAARDRERPAHFLIGAGCSISAGIPSADDLVKRIHREYPAHCADLPPEMRSLYGNCMALLSLNERRDLIRPYLEKAKINWGTIALAQLLAKGFVARVLTANFDMVLESAGSLLGLQPAVYDFGVAPANDPAMIVSPAIIHLHGQSYGLVLLFAEAGEKYAAALAIKPDNHEALNNWGNLLLERGKRSSGEDAARLFAEAGEEHAGAAGDNASYD